MNTALIATPQKNEAFTQIIANKRCPCGKSTNSCDCIACAKCGVLFKPFDNQIICKKCQSHILEVL